MEDKGVKFTQPPKDEDGFKSAKFLDLDGNEYCLFESALANKVRQEG